MRRDFDSGRCSLSAYCAAAQAGTLRQPGKGNLNAFTLTIQLSQHAAVTHTIVFPPVPRSVPCIPYCSHRSNAVSSRNIMKQPSAPQPPPSPPLHLKRGEMRQTSCPRQPHSVHALRAKFSPGCVFTFKRLNAELSHGLTSPPPPPKPVTHSASLHRSSAAPVGRMERAP